MRHWSFIWNQVISYISYPLTQTFIIIIYHAIKVERQFIITNLSLFRCDCVSKEDWLLVKQNGVCTCAVGGPVATCMWVSLHNTIREIDAEKKIRYCKCPSIVCDYSHHIYIILNCITRHACITHTCIDTDCLA